MPRSCGRRRPRAAAACAAEIVGELMRAPLKRALVVDRGDWIGLLSPTDALRSIELLNRR